jgi:hypothetical protein
LPRQPVGSLAEPDHPAPQRLPVHAADRCCLIPRGAVEYGRNGTHVPVACELSWTPFGASLRRSPDFASDQSRDDRRLRILAVVGDCTRECVTLVADTSISGLRVVGELDCCLPSAASPLRDTEGSAPPTAAAHHRPAGSYHLQ